MYKYPLGGIARKWKYVNPLAFSVIAVIIQISTGIYKCLLVEKAVESVYNYLYICGINGVCIGCAVENQAIFRTFTQFLQF